MQHCREAEKSGKDQDSDGHGEQDAVVDEEAPEARQGDKKAAKDKDKGNQAKNGKKRKHKRTKTQEMKIIQNFQEEDQERDNLVCKLCNRETPLYFYQQEDVIKRLPERSLTKLLTQMRQDLAQKAVYLKYLKISAKFCQPCECKNRRVHTYCVTAQVIRSQRIYCEKCGG